ncbi:helix-turn-helix domain-containing protein [Phnomibacter ginsenosidimutans]|uniref:Helix-turn-helix domain-containing protein n=1 Tax=Phnomibacter ginsenosidimutans TaxID=2676868 RepID=A0A6I6GD81_9BACT|nr:helix-turn-helix transcriptional regulator [Phnomibacter ginsenosidimutans]QGW29733.1 helix-turn-helix domain-containing protein [Phnomibacter ginsenosidimutans]
MEKTIHQGRNVKRFREMLGIKQDVLASSLGLSQQAVSSLEQREQIDEKILVDVAAFLKVPVEAIKSFDEEKAVNIISNTFNQGSFLNTGNTPTFNVNPIEQLIQLHEEKIALYERMLQEKESMMQRLEGLLKAK